MSDKPRALELADALPDAVGYSTQQIRDDSAAELRKKHGQVREMQEALRGLVENEGLEALSYLDKGYGTATNSGKRWLRARAALTNTKDE